jgi:hypothetical protein
MFAAVLALGALGACTEQSGSKGPTPSNTATGQIAGEVAILEMLFTEGPGADQFFVQVIAQSISGAPAPNRQVFMSTTSGTLNPTRGVTDGQGQFTSILTCGNNGTQAMVTAFSEGAVRTASPVGGVCGAQPAPATGTTTGNPPKS